MSERALELVTQAAGDLNTPLFGTIHLIKNNTQLTGYTLVDGRFRFLIGNQWVFKSSLVEIWNHWVEYQARIGYPLNTVSDEGVAPPL